MFTDIRLEGRMRNSKKVESKGIVKDKRGGHKGLVSPGTLTSSRGVEVLDGH